MSLNLTKQRITSAKGRVDKYIDQNILTWATEEILLPGHTDIQKSVSSAAAEGLKLEKTGFMKIDLTWEYYVDDKPYKGTREFNRDYVRPYWQCVDMFKNIDCED